MAEIRAFGALRFTEKAGEMAALTCPPYDIISEAERALFLKENPHNIIRLELPKDGDAPYDTAGETFRRWLDEGILAADEAPGLYIYEEAFEALGKKNSVKGFVCRVRLEEWEKGVVLPHEETLSKAKTDRFNLMLATGANFSSIYSLYFDEDGAVVTDIDKLSAGTPDMEFASADGIVHRVWKVEDAAAIAAITGRFADKKLYIADGHHRYETAVNYRNHLRDKGEITGPDHPANFVMMTLVNMEHPGLVVFPTHRIVRGLETFDADRLIADCKKYFDVTEIPATETQARLDSCAAEGKKGFVFYYRGGCALLVLKDLAVMDELLPGTSRAYRGLDVNVLHTLILQRLLGIDKENMANQKNLIYTRDPAEAVAAVEGGEADCAFLINATRVDEIAAVAGAGEKMPQKSTYFYPKLITGHVMNLLR